MKRLSFLDNDRLTEGDRFFNLENQAASMDNERIVYLIGEIVAIYCYTFNVSHYGLGSTRLEKGLTEEEWDRAYAFGEDKDKPDLAIEINSTSDSIDDLTKYKQLQIKEVWIWQNRELKFYLLEENDYKEIKSSLHLDRIQANTLAKYVNRGSSEDFLKIQREFIALIRG